MVGIDWIEFIICILLSVFGAVIGAVIGTYIGMLITEPYLVAGPIIRYIEKKRGKEFFHIDDAEQGIPWYKEEKK